MRTKSFFIQGWDAAKAKFPTAPNNRLAGNPEPPVGASELQREWFVDGFSAWCSGRFTLTQKGR